MDKKKRHIVLLLLSCFVIGCGSGSSTPPIDTPQDTESDQPDATGPVNSGGEGDGSTVPTVPSEMYKVYRQGLYEVFRQPESMLSSTPVYARDSIDEGGVYVKESYRYINDNWQPLFSPQSRADEQIVLMTADGWTVRKRWEREIKDQIGGLVVVSGDTELIKLTDEEIDIAGKPARTVLAEDVQRGFLDYFNIGEDIVFPDGAKAYRRTRSFPQDWYELLYEKEKIGDTCAPPGSDNCNVVEIENTGQYYTKLDDLIGGSRDSAPILEFETLLSTVQLIGNLGDANGDALFLKSRYDADKKMVVKTEEKGTWERRTVNGEQVIVIFNPDTLDLMYFAGQLYKLFGVHDGYVRSGYYRVKGFTQTAKELQLNKVAFEYLLSVSK